MIAATSWLDYLVAFSTAIAAFGTLAAVVLALYLNVWREKRLRPELTVEDYEDTWFGVGWNPGDSKPDNVWGIPLLVRNASGKETAHQVQVLATISWKINSEDDWFDHIIDQPLVWKFGRLPDVEGILAVDIPAGVNRKIFLAFIGEANQLYRTLWPREGMIGGFANEGGEEIKYTEGGAAVPNSPPIAGVLATYPLNQDDPFWVWRDQEYRLRLTLTSHDSDAVTYEVFVTFTYSEREGKTAEVAGQNFIAPQWSDFKRI